jgi:hypothetical protein
MAYNRIRHIKQLATDYIEDCCYKSFKELTAEDIEYIGMECQCNYQDVCEILGLELPESLKPVAA